MFFRGNGKVLMVFGWQLDGSLTSALQLDNCNNSKPCYGKMRVAQYDADAGSWDFHLEQTDAFGESAAIVVGDWDETTYGAVFIGGAGDDSRFPNNPDTQDQQWSLSINQMRWHSNTISKHKYWDLKIAGAYFTNDDTPFILHPFIDHMKISYPYLFGTTRGNMRTTTIKRAEMVYIWRVEFVSATVREIDDTKPVLCSKVDFGIDGYVLAISHELENSGKEFHIIYYAVDSPRQAVLYAKVNFDANQATFI